MASGSRFLDRRNEREAQGGLSLRTVGWLAEMPADFQDALLRIGVWKIALPGQEFVRAGDPNGGLVGIAEGTAEISMAQGHPDARFVHIAKAGHWAGFRPLLGKSRNVTIVAQSEVLWLLVPQQAALLLLNEQPGYWLHIAQLVNTAYEVTSTIMADLTRRSGRSRLAAALLRLAGCRQPGTHPGEEMDINVPQADIAAMAVMSRNTVNSYLTEFEELGLVEIRYRSIRITHPVGLHQVLEKDE